jgi:hypothetical protein
MSTANLPPPTNDEAWKDKGDTTWARLKEWLFKLSQIVHGMITVQSYSGVVTSQSGALTTVASILSFVDFGNAVLMLFDVTITNAGTGAGALIVPTPLTIGALLTSGAAIDTNTGFQCSVFANGGGGSVSIRKYDSTTIIGTGNRIVGQVFFIKV